MRYCLGEEELFSEVLPAPDSHTVQTVVFGLGCRHS